MRGGENGSSQPEPAVCPQEISSGGLGFFQYREHKMSRLITEVPECFRSSFIPCIIWHFFSTRGQSVQMFPQEKVTTPLTSICFLKCDLCFGYVTQIR